MAPEEFRGLELGVLKFFNPSVTSFDDIATRDWAVMHLEEALVFAVGYLLFVFFGMLFRSKDAAGKKAPEAKISMWKHLSNIFSGKFSSVGPFLMAVVMLAYNAVQVVLCGYMFVEAIKEATAQKYSIFLNDFDMKKTGMARVVHVFYLSKILDFADTFFMIVRSKWNQVTFLHVYHHTSIFLIYWINTSVGYDGDVYYTVVLNSFIHLIMYFYYGCTVAGIKVPIYLKKLVTNSQRIQFVAMNIQGAILIGFNGKYPQRMIIAYIAYILSLLILFTNFHNKTYNKAPKKTE